jgi:capsular exopolysaccharide synthesis family protein
VNQEKNISTSQPESIDFNKLGVVIRNSWIWLVAIFLLINGITQLYLRYTKNLYESSSELKLEVKNDASELGIKNVIEEPNVNILSGEIELIQSKLFLSQVLDNANLGISYHSVGRVTNEELFGKAPFVVILKNRQGLRFDEPVYFEEKDGKSFQLRASGNEQIRGTFGNPVQFGGFEMTLLRNDDFEPGDEQGYFFTIHSREEQLQYLTRNLTAEPLNFNANTIRVSFKDHNASKAQYVLNKIDTLYLLYSNEQKNLANRQKINWLSNELAQIESKMEGFEDYFENFTLQNKTNNLDDDLKQMVTRINELDSQRFKLTQRISHLDRITGELENKKQFVTVSQPQGIPEPLARTMEELGQLLLEQEKLGMSYNEKTFAYRRLQKEVESLRTKVANQLEELRSEAATRLADLNAVKQKLEKEFAHLPDKNTEFSKNLRFYKLNEQLYLTLMQSKSEFEVVQAGTVPDFRILSPASFPVEPISPKRLMISGAGLVASFTLMLLFVGIMYLANNKITSLSELERNLHLPVIGVIPVSRHIRNHGLFVVDQPKSMVSEALRTIRTNLDFFNADIDRKVISISSTVSGEGKSFIAVNLGAMIAMSGRRVVLLDLDMRKKKTNVPAVITDSTKGISTVLIKRNTWQESVVKTAIAEFDFIPSGPHPPNPAELLLNNTFRDLVSDLKEHYDYVIIDTPPVGLVTDGIMAMKHSDLCVYIFRANYSKKEFMVNLQRIININKFTNIGMVLNALPSTGAHKYGYGYYEEADINSKWTQLFKT